MSKGKIAIIGYIEVENLGLCYLKAYLNKAGYNVKIIEFNGINYDEIFNSLNEFKPTIIGFSIIYQGLIDKFSSLIKFLRSRNISGHFTLGGHFPTIRDTWILNNIEGANSVVRGEGEETLKELAEQLAGKKDLFLIKGLTFLDSGRIIRNEPRELIKEIDTIPFPDRNRNKVIVNGYPVYTILTSRGCTHSCSFCSINEFYKQCVGKKQRYRSPENVVEEIKILINDFGAKFLVFEDDDFSLVSKKRVQWTDTFINLLKSNDLLGQFIWRISCRVDEIDFEYLNKLSSAGLVSIYLGIESGNDSSLKIYNKGYNVSTIYKIISKIKECGMPFEFGFMHLNPYTTFDQIIEDIDFFNFISLDNSTNICFTKMIPYAGTKIERDLINEKRLIGSIAKPDYYFIDERIDLYQVFLAYAFHKRNFDPDGSVELLRRIKLMLYIQKHKKSMDYLLEKKVNEIIYFSNNTVINILQKTSSMMKELTYDEIITHWNIFAELISESIEADYQVSSSVKELLSDFA